MSFNLIAFQLRTAVSQAAHAVTPTRYMVRYDVRMKLLGRRRVLLDDLEKRLPRSIAELPSTAEKVPPGGRGSAHRLALATAWASLPWA